MARARTLEQNKAMWAILTRIAEQDQVKGLEPREWKGQFTKVLFGEERRTSTLRAGEFNDLLMLLHVYSLDYGIRLGDEP